MMLANKTRAITCTERYETIFKATPFVEAENIPFQIGFGGPSYEHINYSDTTYFCNEAPDKKAWKCSTDATATEYFYMKAVGGEGNTFDKLILEKFDRGTYGFAHVTDFNSNIDAQPVNEYITCQ